MAVGERSLRWMGTDIEINLVRELDYMACKLLSCKASVFFSVL